MAKPYEENRLPNLIGSGTKFTGDIETNGDLRVDGQIEGNILSKGKIVLGSGGTIKGTIKCVSAEISGSFEGKMEVSELLSLTSSAKFRGDMTISKLSIEPGAMFNGTCVMGGAGQAGQTPAKK